MKKYNLIISLILLCVILTLAGCMGGTSDAVDTTTNGQDTTLAVPDETTAVEVEEPKNILASDLEKYVVVRPDECDKEVTSAVSDLYGVLKASFGTASLKTDFLIPGNSKFEAVEFEILIGDTNRAETQEFMETLRVNDYGYALIGKKIVIAGGSDNATLLAIQAFQTDIVSKRPGADGVFIKEDDAFVFRAEYSIDDLKLNGNSINDYTIVYKNSGTHGEKELAKTLSSTITNLTGYVLDVMSDKEEYAGGLEILIGVTNRDAGKVYDRTLADGEYFIGSGDKCIAIWGSTPFATMSAANDFGKRLTACLDENAHTELLVEDSIAKVQDGVELSAMSFNVWVSGRTAERDASVIQMVLNYMPDVVGFQEASPSWMSTLIQNLGTYYSYVGEGRDGGSSGEYNPIFYRKDKFKLLESDTQWLSETPDKVSKYSESSLNRIYTYAKLQRISDGMEFMHINTHFDHTSNVARELQAKVLAKFIAEKAGIPMVITGDFNCQSTTTAYKTLVSCGISNSYDIAEKREGGATFHGNGSSSKVIDFIFVDPDQVYVTHYNVCNEKINGGYVSDHHPVYIKFNVIY